MKSPLKSLTSKLIPKWEKTQTPYNPRHEFPGTLGVRPLTRWKSSPIGAEQDDASVGAFLFRELDVRSGGGRPASGGWFDGYGRCYTRYVKYVNDLDVYIPKTCMFKPSLIILMIYQPITGFVKVHAYKPTYRQVSTLRATSENKDCSEVSWSKKWIKFMDLPSNIWPFKIIWAETHKMISVVLRRCCFFEPRVVRSLQSPAKVLWGVGSSYGEVGGFSVF